MTPPSNYSSPLYPYLAPNLNPTLAKSSMNSESKALKSSLQKREMEILRLIRQMKFDQLHNSTVYKNLEQELESVKNKLLVHEDLLRQ